ncbi:uncharacterized protein LOC143611196 [Bidens hawaiensis]|uniref:uncharacterized protein LOC143611196 n=1 Tax=Bidens hawaiensis TaxID=980011 RepID=UPI00404A31F6
MDELEASTNKIPRLIGQDNYIKWKIMFEASVCYNDVEMWNSIKNGPYVLDDTNNNQTVERQMRKKDDKALSMLKLGMSYEILTSVANHTTAKAMFDAIVEMFEGSTKLKDIKDRPKQQLDRFKFKEGERLNSVLHRFVAIVNEIRTTNLAITNFDLNNKLLSSLSGEWYTASKFIKEKVNFLTFKLDDVICFLQADEHEMIENSMIKEDKPNFRVANALIAPIGNLSAKNQQQIPIIEEPSEYGVETPGVFVAGQSSNQGRQSRFNVQLTDDNDTSSMASGQAPMLLEM